MTPDPIASAALEFTIQVEGLYGALMRSATTPPDGEPSLGGKLLYTGELDAQGRALLVAGNIAGAASLAATADNAAQKQAIRDGVADFLVNSLDEALRILKNEVRKRETVAVCIAAAPEAVESEMMERGVVADLLRRIGIAPVAKGEVLLTWRVDIAPAQWLPKIDAVALNCLDKNAVADLGVARRWLRLAPRFLGRMAQGVRVLRCDSRVADQLVSNIKSAVNRGEIGVAVRTSTEF